jgi:hypothetical protein
MELGAPLSNQDAPRGYFLASIPLNAQSLGCTISSIAGTSHAFFVCHNILQIIAPAFGSARLYCVYSNTFSMDLQGKIVPDVKNLLTG